MMRSINKLLTVLFFFSLCGVGVTVSAETLEKEIQHLRQRVSQLRIDMQRNDNKLKEVIQAMEKKISDMQASSPVSTFVQADKQTDADIIEQIEEPATTETLTNEKTTSSEEVISRQALLKQLEEKKKEVEDLKKLLQQNPEKSTVTTNFSTETAQSQQQSSSQTEKQADSMQQTKSNYGGQATDTFAEESNVLYNQGIDLLSKSEYVKAQKTFTELIEIYPQSHRVSDARYWLAETYYFQENFEKAYLEYDFLVKNFPNNDKVGIALLKSGLSKMEVEKYQEAEDIFNQVVHQYPSTKLAQEAHHKLGLIKILDRKE